MHRENVTVEKQRREAQNNLQKKIDEIYLSEGIKIADDQAKRRSEEVSEQ